ncbi:MAG TPA: hypothetical protein VM639_02820 [Dongiaceae bacterium]|nr:hypothetical protein [Dongiaceae bacterium]
MIGLRDLRDAQLTLMQINLGQIRMRIVIAGLFCSKTSKASHQGTGRDAAGMRGEGNAGAVQDSLRP